MEGTASEPRIRRQRIIERPRLLRLLDESPANVRMLVAPAGYGKTTLARQWLGTRPAPAMWITASPAAADVAVLFGELCRVLGRAAPGTNDRLRQRLAVTADPEAEWPVLAEILIEDIQSLDSPPYLAIDDYHALAESEAAESIVAQIAGSGVCDLFVVGRSRPCWVSARQILYGEVLELGPNVLAMTNDEADSAFGESVPLSPGLVHLAQGWPAVLALAARAPDSSFPDVGDALPETLHAFFAEELYQSLDESVQRGLTRVALAEVDDVETAREFFPDVERALEQAAAVGWISDPRGDTIDLHPLLRAFLRRKLERDEPDQFRAACETTANLLIERGRWDEAARLIVEQKLYPLLVPLLEASLESLLSQGRLATVREWVAMCRDNAVDAPVLRLAAAELAFRAGQFFEAEVVAASVAELEASEQLRFRALALAGRAAHIGSREDAALNYFRAAGARASEAHERETAAFGELLAATELELPEADELFQELDRLTPKSPVQRVSLAGRGLSLDARFGRPPRLDVGRSAYKLLGAVIDPVARCAFRNIFAYGLAQSGALREASAVLDEQRDEVAAYRLDFATGYADLTECTIHLVAGDYAAADATLDRLEGAARKSGDWFLLANATALCARSLVGRGAFDEAVARTMEDSGGVGRSLAMEILATRALALACGGRTVDALAVAKDAIASSQSTEVAVLTSAARAVAATIDSRPDAFSSARDALAVSRTLSSFEGFVAALRGCPEMGVLLMDMPETRRELMPILTVSNESARYERLGGESAQRGSATWRDLSTREQQVLQLVAEGMTNPQIAAKLFITEATVKAHVHHILEKLGVPTRTAAALRVPAHARAKRPPQTGEADASHR